jgi:SAM-dependent methyltransferase
MSANRESVNQFLNFCENLEGRERQEAQTFLNRFFQAFGYQDAADAGAKFELPIPKASSKGFIGYADLWWPRDSFDTLLIEMKSRRENLNRHYGQAWDYWKELNPRPKYVILCNFDEFWIYDFEIQVDTPIEKVRLVELYERLEAFRFMEFTKQEPVFRNNQAQVTAQIAKKMGAFYKLLKYRCQKAGFTEKMAQKFTLQCVMAMFAEDTGLLGKGLFLECIEECLAGKAISYDLLNDGLFRRMNEKKNLAGRFKGVDYFNGGLFAEVHPIELNREELELLKRAANDDWRMVRPAIFGSIFEGTSSDLERHTEGMHFTSENDIMKIVRPTISRYWEEKIEAINSVKEIELLKQEMRHYKVLDPACGSGNFLYMAYQELKQSESLLLKKSADLRKTDQLELSFVTPLQFFGIDNNDFAVELARVTLLIARKVAIDKLNLTENPLPLDTLDQNIIKGDALFIDWPVANAIIGNPPFQSKNKMQQEFGAKYVSKLRESYPDIPGRADYCVYWFYKAHRQLPENGHAGLVGTNTIRQNYSREGGLDYIVNHGGTITEAVSTQVWSGDAVVHVSIVNWVKGDKPGKKKLSMQIGDSIDSPWEIYELDRINSALSPAIDLSQANKLQVNLASKSCYQGQTHGHEGFLLNSDQVMGFFNDPKSQTHIYPYLTADELLSMKAGFAFRYVIDFNQFSDINSARKVKKIFQHLSITVKPDLELKAKEEFNTLKKNGPRQTHFKHWWKYWRDRPELIEKLSSRDRYIVCGQVMKRPIFEFVSTKIRPNAALMIFPFADDYTFGILQSSMHWLWFTHRCSTLKGDFRYTSNTIFNTFPFPQFPEISHIEQVAQASQNLRQQRRQLMQRYNWSLRDLYRQLEQSLIPPDVQIFQQAQSELDKAVDTAYGLPENGDRLEFLLALNWEVSSKEKRGEPVTAPGLPDSVIDPSIYSSSDCIGITD